MMVPVNVESYDIVKDFISEQGSMKFSELREHAGLSDEQLISIESILKKEKPSIIKKGKSYEVKDFDKINQTKESSKESSFDILQYEWERKGAEELTKILKHKQLYKDLIDGEITYAFKQLVKESKGCDKNSFTKKDLTHILLLCHGRDLLSNKTIRNIISKAHKISKKDIPKRWVSGSFSARKFVQQINFPKEFSGIKSDVEKLPSTELLRSGKFNQLVNFQNEIKERILQKLTIRPSKFLISLPTGAGKTKVAVHSILEYINNAKKTTSPLHIMWLAHTEELCEQAYICFKETANHIKRDYDIRLFRYWGSYAVDDIGESIDTPYVFISTPQKIKNILDFTSYNQSEKLNQRREVESFFKKNLFLLVIDEAHRAGSPTYQKIVEQLSEKNDFLNTAGLTATPFRKEYMKNQSEEGTEDLKKIFGQLILPEKTLGSDLIQIKKELRNRQYLSGLKKIKIDTGMSIQLKETDKNFISTEDIEQTSALDRKLQARTDTTKRRLIILKAIKEQVAKSPDGKFLYFGPTVKDVRLMTLLLREASYRADYIVGDRKMATRRKIIDDFKNGKLQFLCNCEVLTTGFDEPKITHLVMARPTVSQVLYEQMIGRGLRGIKFGGTDACTVLSCEDMNLDYSEFYRIWRTESDYQSYSFEEVFIRTLVFALRADGKHKDSEKSYLKKSLKENLDKEVNDQYIDQKIEENFKYFDELPAMAEKLTRGEKSILMQESIEMCKVDGELHSKEKEFLGVLENHLKYGVRFLDTV